MFGFNNPSAEKRREARIGGTPVFPVRCSLADCSGINGESFIVGEQTVGADRRRSVKPGEECQFLRMIGHAIGHRHGREEGAAKRISYLEVALAALDLACVAPRW